MSIGTNVTAVEESHQASAPKLSPTASEFKPSPSTTGLGHSVLATGESASSKECRLSALAAPFTPYSSDHQSPSSVLYSLNSQCSNDCHQKNHQTGRDNPWADLQGHDGLPSLDLPAQWTSPEESSIAQVTPRERELMTFAERLEQTLTTTYPYRKSLLSGVHQNASLSAELMEAMEQAGGNRLPESSDDIVARLKLREASNALEQFDHQDHADPMAAVLKHAMHDRNSRDEMIRTLKKREEALIRSTKLREEAFSMEIGRLTKLASMTSDASSARAGTARTLAKARELEARLTEAEEAVHRYSQRYLQMQREAAKVRELRKANDALQRNADYHRHFCFHKTSVDGPTEPVGTVTDEVVTRLQARFGEEFQIIKPETISSEEAARLRKVIRITTQQRDEAEEDNARLRPLLSKFSDMKRQALSALVLVRVENRKRFQPRLRNKRLLKQNKELKEKKDRVETQTEDSKNDNNELQKELKELRNQQEEINKNVFDARKERDGANKAQDAAEKELCKFLESVTIGKESRGSSSSLIGTKSNSTEDRKVYLFSEGIRPPPERRFRPPLEKPLSPLECLQPTGTDKICP